MKTVYNSFAKVYDRLTDDVDYDKIYGFIKDIFDKYELKPELVLELACGTGSFTKRLCDAGYDVIALDSSYEMLDVAREKCPDALLLNQDMTEFELYGTVDAVMCILDGVNYITDKRKLLKMFRLVENYLNYGGLFVFDINSEYKLTDIIGNNTFIRSEEDIFYTWENEKRKDKVDFYLTFFNKVGLNYERFEEIHTERIYKTVEIKKLIEDSGLEFLGAYPDFKFSKLSKKDERIFFIARKKS